MQVPTTPMFTDTPATTTVVTPEVAQERVELGAGERREPVQARHHEVGGFWAELRDHLGTR